jgi:Na+/melibiose symporter-like transporter
MTAAICCYSGVSFVAYFARTPEQLLVARFVVCMGVGGMWPNGVAPIVLGLLVPLIVPESPSWLAQRTRRSSPGTLEKTRTKPQASTGEIFRPVMFAITLVGILLATVPLFGAWGSSNWAVKWAEDAGSDGLKAQVIKVRSLPGIFGSFMGGWIASFVGRRRSYFFNSLICLGSAQCMFWFSSPTEPTVFLVWTAVLGFFSGIFFGCCRYFCQNCCDTCALGWCRSLL